MLKTPLTHKRIFFFWVPLAATWLMMAAEGPVLAAVIARLAAPKFNLAAFGIAFSFAVLIESPIIMIMSASTALVNDKDSFLKLRNFTYFLNGFITLIMVIFLIPVVFDFITLNLIGLPENVADLTHKACFIMLPWPGAIGYRRFYQGILIRNNLTRRVAYGTIIRLSCVSVVAFFCYFFYRMDGALVGALALSIAVCLESAASKLMARNSVKKLQLLVSNDQPKEKKALTYRSISKFYYPLALTSMLGLGVHPLVTFFLGQSRMALESLAVMPVVISFIFIFRSLGLSFLEVGIALLGIKNEGYKILRNFTFILSCVVLVVLFLVAFTPLSYIWYHTISGLSADLAGFAVNATLIMILMPSLTVIISFQRSILVNNHKTKPVTIATAIEVVCILCVLFFAIKIFDIVGVIAAALALFLGRLLADLYLISPCYFVLKKN